MATVLLYALMTVLRHGHLMSLTHSLILSQFLQSHQCEGFKPKDSLRLHSLG